jgi:hypothetical protein
MTPLWPATTLRPRRRAKSRQHADVRRLAPTNGSSLYGQLAAVTVMQVATVSLGRVPVKASMIGELVRSIVSPRVRAPALDACTGPADGRDLAQAASARTLSRPVSASGRPPVYMALERSSRMRTKTRIVLVAALGLVVAVGVSQLVLVREPKISRIGATRTSVMELQRAAEVWRAKHATDGCPTPEQLRAAGAVDRLAKLNDAWGTPFEIACAGDATSVRSLGPDRKWGDDDIVAPESSGP